MDSFFSLLNRLGDEPSPPNNRNATPTLPDMANTFRLVQDQFRTLAETAPSEQNRFFLLDLAAALDDDVHEPPVRLDGVAQEFLDGLDRVDRRHLEKDDDCAICKIPYLEDKYCLVVELPCPGAHRFDLECVGPWLRSKGTCPLCREKLGSRKSVQVVVESDDEEEDDVDMLYA